MDTTEGGTVHLQLDMAFSDILRSGGWHCSLPSLEHSIRIRNVYNMIVFVSFSVVRRAPDEVSVYLL
jgi:hypothetical protein